MITDLPQEVYYDDAPVTIRLAAPMRDALITLSIAARLLICLAAIYAGMVISVQSTDSIAVLAALGCGGVIYGLLGRHEP